LSTNSLTFPCKTAPFLVSLVCRKNNHKTLGCFHLKSNLYYNKEFDGHGIVLTSTSGTERILTDSISPNAANSLVSTLRLVRSGRFPTNTVLSRLLSSSIDLGERIGSDHRPRCSSFSVAAWARRARRETASSPVAAARAVAVSRASDP